MHNVRNWQSDGDQTMGVCCFSFFCFPWAIGYAMRRSLGMPFCLACFCVTPCEAHNLVRYQHRINGDDYLDECMLPVCFSAAFYVLLSPICCLLPTALLVAQAVAEATIHEPPLHPGYLASNLLFSGPDFSSLLEDSRPLLAPDRHVIEASASVIPATSSIPGDTTPKEGDAGDVVGSSILGGNSLAANTKVPYSQPIVIHSSDIRVVPDHVTRLGSSFTPVAASARQDR
jgi:hypothetical protein